MLFLLVTDTPFSGKKYVPIFYQFATLNQQLSLETTVCPWTVRMLDPLKHPPVLKERKNTRGHAISEMVYSNTLLSTNTYM